jgi:hypothetical protein
LKKLLIIACVILIIIAFSNFSKVGEIENVSTPNEYITISVLGKEKEIIVSEQIVYKEEYTVYDVLKEITKKNKIQMETKGLGDLIYVSGIDNLYELEEGPLSGWMFKVNEKIPSVGIGGYKLEPGDNILVYYVLDFGKEFTTVE